MPLQVTRDAAAEPTAEVSLASPGNRLCTGASGWQQFVLSQNTTILFLYQQSHGNKAGNGNAAWFDAWQRLLGHVRQSLPGI